MSHGSISRQAVCEGCVKVWIGSIDQAESLCQVRIVTWLEAVERVKKGFRDLAKSLCQASARGMEFVQGVLREKGVGGCEDQAGLFCQE
jgi:hypothetical protein